MYVVYIIYICDICVYIAFRWLYAMWEHDQRYNCVYTYTKNALGISLASRRSESVRSLLFYQCGRIGKKRGKALQYNYVIQLFTLQKAEDKKANKQKETS